MVDNYVVKTLFLLVFNTSNQGCLKTRHQGCLTLLPKGV